MTEFLKRAAGGSAVVGAARRLGRGSLLGAVVGGALGWLMRPSLAYMGGSVPKETDEESRAAIEAMWAVVLDSAPGRAVLRAVPAVSHAWRHSRTVAAYGAIRAFEPAAQIEMAGWIVLVAVLASGAERMLSAEPWPGLSMLIWVTAGAAAGLLIVASRQLLAAWKGGR